MSVGTKLNFGVLLFFIALMTTTIALAAAPKGLVGHWHLDEGIGKIAKDSSTEKNDGELWAGAKWVKEGVDKGGNFTGKGLAFKPPSGLKIPAQGVDSLEQVTAGITLSAWIKILGPPTEDQGNIVAKPGSYYLVYREGKLGMYLYGPSDDGGLGYKTGKTKLPLNKWMHVALTYDQKKIFLYLDGKVDFSTSAKEAIKTRNNEAFVGIGVERKKSRLFHGMIDEVMIYANVGLSQEEIQDKLIDQVLPVNPSDKLAVSWGIIKAER